jgi:hypothetical protein
MQIKEVCINSSNLVSLRSLHLVIPASINIVIGSIGLADHTLRLLLISRTNPTCAVRSYDPTQVCKGQRSGVKRGDVQVLARYDALAALQHSQARPAFER